MSVLVPTLSTGRHSCALVRPGAGWWTSKDQGTGAALHHSEHSNLGNWVRKDWWFAENGGWTAQENLHHTRDNMQNTKGFIHVGSHRRQLAWAIDRPLGSIWQVSSVCAHYEDSLYRWPELVLEDKWPVEPCTNSFQSQYQWTLYLLAQTFRVVVTAGSGTYASAWRTLRLARSDPTVAYDVKHDI